LDRYLSGGHHAGQQLPSLRWQYTPSTAGNASFTGLAKGNYFVAFFVNDSYTERAQRMSFTVRSGADLNGDGAADAIDRNLLRQALGKCSGAAGYNSDYDYDGDNCITQRDYQAWYAYFTNP
jgi:hypothetical protein